MEVCTTRWTVWRCIWIGAVASLATACGNDVGGSRAAPAEPPACGVSQPAVLTDSGVGALRVGAPVAQVKGLCQVLLDTTLAHGNEGQPERRLTVVLGSISTTATVADDRIWRVEISSPVFRTRDSLGVGSTVGELRRPDAQLAMGEGLFILRKDHCGLSFEIEGQVGQYRRRLASVPDSVRVIRVLVVGCG